MSRFSINFENEDQYKNFIQSIKDEVIKEIPVQQHRVNNHWDVIKNELKEEIAKRKRKEGGRRGTVAGHEHYYAFYKEAFNCFNVSHLSVRDEDQLRSFKKELFDLIDKYREANE